MVTVAAEKGYLRETGNLVFHAALVVLLVGVALGKLCGYQGTVLLTEGQPGICNAVAAVRLVPARASWSTGPDWRRSASTRSTSSARDYDPDGTPAQFRADITYSLGAGRRPSARMSSRSTTRCGSEGVRRLSGRTRLRAAVHGHQARRHGVKDVSAPFLPQNPTTLLSEGAVKLLDTVKPQLALYGTFAPFAALGPDGKLTSLSPQPGNPGVAIQVYRGDLGVDGGAPQSVYSIDQRQVAIGALKQVATAQLLPGKSVTLDDGTKITFDGYSQWATLQVNHDPGQTLVLWAAGAVVLGLLLSLAVRRRRLFLRITPAPSPDSETVDNSAPVDDGARPGGGARSVVAVGGLARTDAGNFGDGVRPRRRAAP